MGISVSQYKSIKYQTRFCLNNLAKRSKKSKKEWKWFLYFSLSCMHFETHLRILFLLYFKTRKRGRISCYYIQQKKNKTKEKRESKLWNKKFMCSTNLALNLNVIHTCIFCIIRQKRDGTQAPVPLELENQQQRQHRSTK